MAASLACQPPRHEGVASSPCYKRSIMSASDRPDPVPGAKWSLAELARRAREHPDDPAARFRTLVGTFRVPPDDAETPALGHLSCHFWRLAPGEVDDQSPHDEDELYFVLAGSATLTVEEREVPLAPGDLVYVPRYAHHRFHHLGPEGLDLLVFFAPDFTG